MRSDDLLAAVFPAQVGCQDNAMTPDLEVPDHPLVFETLRDCLTEAVDMEGLKGVLAAIETGGIEVYARDTVQPSVFAHQILNAMPYAFLDDAPLEERRARAVSLRRALPEDARDLGALDPEAIRDEAQNAWPRVRDADELHDALLLLGVLPESEAARNVPRESMEAWFTELVNGGRAFRLHHQDGGGAWVAAERIPDALAAYLGARLEPDPTEELVRPAESPTEDAAILALVRGWVECSGPFTPREMADILRLRQPDVYIALAQLEAEGLVLRGTFRSDVTEEEFCDRRILARIHRATIGRLRKEVEPVSQAAFLRFLMRWQHADPSSRLKGEGGLLDVIERLQGFEAAAGAWESELLPYRVSDYQSFHLDRLCLGGEVVWGRPNGHQDNGTSYAGRGSLSRITPITVALRESLDWLLDPRAEDDSDASGARREILEVLSRRGASFQSDLAAATRRLPSDVEEALWLLAAAGRVTSDSVEALRQRIRGSAGGGRRASRLRRSGLHRRPGYSRWSVFEAPGPCPEPIEPRARQLLLRYGVLCPELVAREAMAPRWRDLVRVLRRLEARGEIRGGRFVAGTVGEQFALPEAVDMLRSVKAAEPKGEWVVVSACDPLNVVGILTPGERVPAVLGNRIAFKDGVPMCALEGGNLVDRAGVDGATSEEARALLRRPPLEDGTKMARGAS